MNYDTLLTSQRTDRVEVILNRPEVKNAINQRMIDELHTVCAKLEADPRILIIAGVGGVFASGADIEELRERGRDEALAGINSGLFDRIRHLPAPVIAAVDGVALGGGAELAYAADFRVGGPNLRLGNPETSLGIMAAAGATWRLRELVGEPLANEMLLAGRQLSAAEALETRLITELTDTAGLMPAAHALADRIARNDPLATRLTKSVMLAPRSAHPTIDNHTQAVLFESPEKHRRMTAFLERKRR